MIDKSPVTYPASKPPAPAPATENAYPPPPPGAAGVQRDRLTLQQEEVTLRTLFDTLPDILYVKDLDLTYRLVNPACCHLMGLGDEAVIGRGDRDPRFPPDLVATMMRHDPEVLAQGEPRLNESLVTGADGTPRWFRTRVTPLRDASDRIAGLFGVGQDITALMAEQGRGQRLSRLRQHLLDLVDRDDHELILRTALDVAEELTHSQIGFLHFISEDEREVSLQVWSTRTRAEMCFAEGNGLHYPISQAGVWVDCILQRQPVIHNDYASLPHQKGMPEGHTPLVREATVPLLVDGRVVAVIGVGNKAHDYSQQDLEILGQILEIAIHCADRQRFERQQEYLAFYDVLTGLPNRALLIEQLNQAIAQANRSNQLIAVCYLNLDAFKLINETYGQPIGDALLVSLAQRLQGSLRPGDALARAGGDEFALILAGLASAFEGQEAVQRVVKQITQPIDVQGHRIFVAGSMGVTLFPLDPDGPDALLHHAQKAMYQAKGMNRSGYHFYDPVQDQQMRQLRRLREEFTLALQDGQLLLYYQPKIDLRDASLIGLEALIRWRHPREGLLEPAQFLPQIKDSPLEIALGEWVVTQALAQQQAWRQVGVALAVSINVSPRQIQMRGFADLVTRTLAAYPPGTAEQLEIEILDIAEIGNTGDAAQVMNACKALGVRFALDDFGTGYSSLTYFQHLPIDIVKIDQHFAREMLDKNEALGIVEAALRMANALQRPVVAEGIESVEIGFMLARLGCQFGQGFGIARPMPAEQVLPWLTQWQGEDLWHPLGKESLAASVKYDLEVAMFSLRLWLNHLLASLSGAAGGTSPPLDEYQCQFHRWYHGIGRARYGGNPNFAFIQAQHYQIHQLGAMLVDLAASGQAREAQARRGELEALGEAMIRLLRRLERT
jgi:diguanylate cyclase (GGDEF)-like protein/PAS domain S-box-containing protein